MNPNETNNKDILKQIESGKYCEQYLIYNRRSSDEPENQKNSLKYQRFANAKYAYSERLPIAQIAMEGFCLDGIISEKHSAFKESKDLILKDNGFVQYRIDRPKFYKLAQFLSKKYFKGVIVLCWDRICRNDSDEAIIKKLMKSDIDFQFALAEYQKTSAGALHMDIDGMFAVNHSRVTSEKVRLNIYYQREKGICTYVAPVGYLNTGSMQEKPIDKLRAPVIKQMYELYATGQWSLSDMTQWAITQGFTMPPRRRKRTQTEKLQDEEDDMLLDIPKASRIPRINSIHRILSNPFYTGKVLGNKGEYVKSNSHKAIITEDLFNKVQKLLHGKNVSIHYASKILYPLRGMFRCNACKRVYTPYLKKGNIYFGARCLKTCTNTHRCFSTQRITEFVGNGIRELSFTESEFAEIESRATAGEIKLLEEERTKQSEVRERKRKKITEDITYLQANKLNLLKTGVYTPETIIAEENKLNDQLYSLQREESTSVASIAETIGNVIKLSELLKTLHLYYENANPEEKEPIIKTVFSELNIYRTALIYKCNSGFAALQSRFVPSCALNEWLSELPYRSKDIEESISDVEELLKKQSHP